MNKKETAQIVQILSELEPMEKEVCNLSLFFSETFKDEINANDEQKMYRSIKRVIRKYAADTESMTAIDEFTRAMTGGASLTEIFLIAKEEAASPSLASGLTIDDHCKLDQN